MWNVFRDLHWRDRTNSRAPPQRICEPWHQWTPPLMLLLSMLSTTTMTSIGPMHQWLIAIPISMWDVSYRHGTLNFAPRRALWTEKNASCHMSITPWYTQSTKILPDLPNLYHPPTLYCPLPLPVPTPTYFAEPISALQYSTFLYLGVIINEEDHSI